MNVNINCKSNDRGAWCKDTRIKKSLFGFGARCCLVFCGERCRYQDKHTRPPPPLRLKHHWIESDIVIKLPSDGTSKVTVEIKRHTR